MPELPEVEWMVARLRPAVENRKIEKVEIIRSGNEYFKNHPQAPSSLEGQHIFSMTRRGKHILFRLENGYLVSHNNMSGYWDSAEDPGTFDYVEGNRQANESDVRVKLHLNGLTLRFHDARLFGSFRYQPSHEFPLHEMGPEAINTPNVHKGCERWNLLDAATSIGGSKRPIKQILMDQECVAGIGNIYATEALWAARVDPHKEGRKLSSGEVASVFNSVQAIMKTALAHNLDYTKYLRVYRKERCHSCEGLIIKTKVGGRSTYFCQECQR